MALLPGHVTNFQTLLRAAHDGNLSLMQCQDADTGEYRAVICMVEEVTHVADGTVEFRFVPVGHLANGNPYECYIPVESSANEGEPA
jgi:hypothetical protein